MNASTIKIGLIGLGFMGQNHLRNLSILKQVDIGFIYDVNQTIVQQVANEYHVPVSHDLKKDLPNVDAVIIVSPTSTHAEYVNLASQHVKHIFVEKPLTNDLKTTQEIHDLVEEKGLQLQVGFIERYNPAVTALKKVLKNSAHTINIDFMRTNKVSSRITDVDVVMDLMIHDIDLALHLNGSAVKVEAHGYVHNGMIEYARANITHQNHAFSNIVASRITEKRIRQINATCDNMYVDCNLLSKKVVVNKQTIEQYLDSVSISAKEETINVQPQEGLLLELLDFIDACNGKQVNVPNVKEALDAITVAQTIQQQIIKDNTLIQKVIQPSSLEVA